MLTVHGQYNDNNSWGLSYNLYADKLLKTNIFPRSIFELRELSFPQ